MIESNIQRIQPEIRPENGMNAGIADVDSWPRSSLRQH
jgi:hypothetical protein